MKVFYISFIFVYRSFIRVASLVNPKARLFVRGRKDWKETLKGRIDEDASYIWFHCASLGEFEQGRPLIERIKESYNQYKIVLTFFSPSGYEMRKNYDGADIVMYLPFDTSSNAKKFMDIVKPEKIFFVKYEFWHFFISEANRRQIPLYLVSAVFHANGIFFKKDIIGEWYRRILRKFDHIFVQDNNSVKFLREAGITKCTVSGDTRIDRVAAIARDAKKFPVVERFRGNYPLIIAGSTWKPDEELLTEYINNNREVKIIIAPHEVSNANLQRLQQMIKVKSVRFSKVNNIDITDYKVLIIDSIGLLSSLYRYGSLAYIGGGFGAGIHNILEPAVFGLPVIFGPVHEKFKEATDLKLLNGAWPVENFRQLENVLNLLLNNPDKLSSSSAICKNYILKNIGATTIIIKKVFNN